MKITPTYRVEIDLGLSEGYISQKPPYTLQDVADLIQPYCEKYKFGVTLTATTIVYPSGREPGCTISLINYPRYPREEEIVRHNAVTIAKLLGENLRQERLTVTTPLECILLEADIDYRRIP